MLIYLILLVILVFFIVAFYFLNRPLKVSAYKFREGGGKEVHEEGADLIKAPVVLGENVIQRMEISDLPLEKTAIKIKEVKTSFRNLKKDLARGSVLLEGILHKDIYYVGQDKLVHHQEEDNSFTYVVNLPGIEAGMDVLVEPSVEQLVYNLKLEGNILQQKVVLQFFVKVLAEESLMVLKGPGPLVMVERIVGENSTHSLLENEVVLAEKAVQINQLTAFIKEIESKVLEDKVIIQGLIHKDLYYIAEDGLEHHQEEEIPFNDYVDLAGAEPGMEADLQAEIEHLDYKLLQDGMSLRQKVVFNLQIQVTEKVKVNLRTGEDSLLMLPEIIGENTKQILQKHSCALAQPAQTIKEIKTDFTELETYLITDRVLIQGKIREDIYYIGQDQQTYQQGEKLDFSTIIDINGARPGMKVDLIPEISYLKSDLNDGGTILNQRIMVDLFVEVSEKIQFNIQEDKKKSLG